MKKGLVISLIGIFFLTGCCIVFFNVPSKIKPPRQTETLILKDVYLIDATGKPPKENMTIVIKDGIITDIGKEVSIPKGAKILNLSDKVALPGLIDVHVHLLQSGASDFKKPFAESIITKLRRNSSINLKAGITTLRNMPGFSGYSVLKFRDKINKGKIIGPRILTSGPAITVPCGYFSIRRFVKNPILRFFISPFHGVSIEVKNEEEARKAVRKLKRKGIDFIKTVAPQAFFPPSYKNQMTKEILQEIVYEAHKLKMKVACHITLLPGIKEAAKAGVDSIEHTPYGLIDDETFYMMKEKNIFWVPTAFTFHNWLTLIDNPALLDRYKRFIPEPFFSLAKEEIEEQIDNIKNNRSKWKDLYEAIKLKKEKYFPENFKKALEKGVKIVAGTDGGAAGTGFVPHGKLIEELKIFVKHGMSEYEAILSATKYPAELLSLDKDIGTIEPGKVADILLLSSNPLDDISNLKDIYLVIKEGAVVYKIIEKMDIDAKVLLLN